MRIRIIAIGNKMPDWVNEGFQEYVKRFPPSSKIELIEIPAEKRSKQSDITRLIEHESQKILSRTHATHRIIALDVKGQSWSTEKLSQQIKHWQIDGRTIDLCIGGPDGLSPDCLQKAEIRWSLSPLTLPHPLVRILLVEQLYRAFSILQNHPYHR